MLSEQSLSQNTLQRKKTFADVVLELKESKAKPKKRRSTLKKIKDVNSSQEWNSSEDSNTSLIGKLMKRNHDIFTSSRLKTASNINTLKSAFYNGDSK